MKSFDIELGRLGKPSQLTALWHGIEAALAVAPGDVLSAAEYPLLGFYFTFSPEQFLAYFVTPGRFVRYEVAGGRSLTVTVALERVSRVVEAAGEAELIVTVELDADAATSIVETQTETQPGTQDNGGVARGAMRSLSRLHEPPMRCGPSKLLRWSPCRRSRGRCAPRSVSDPPTENPLPGPLALPVVYR